MTFLSHSTSTLIAWQCQKLVPPVYFICLTGAIPKIVVKERRGIRLPLPILYTFKSMAKCCCVAPKVSSVRSGRVTSNVVCGVVGGGGGAGFDCVGGDAPETAPAGPCMIMLKLWFWVRQQPQWAARPAKQWCRWPIMRHIDEACLLQPWVLPMLGLHPSPLSQIWN